MEINEGRARRRGRRALDDPRTHCVSVRLNDEELKLLNAKRAAGGMERGEWLRCSALDRLPPIVPEPNEKKWQELGRCAANLNQVARSLNQLKGISDDQFAEVRAVLNDFRRALLGAKNS